MVENRRHPRDVRDQLRRDAEKRAKESLQRRSTDVRRDPREVRQEFRDQGYRK